MSIASMVSKGIERQRQETETRNTSDPGDVVESALEKLNMEKLDIQLAVGGYWPVGVVGAGTRGATEDPDASKKAVSSAMENVSAFIPSEVIGIYVAGFGILSPDNNKFKWLIFGVSLAAVPVMILLNYLVQKKCTGTKLSPRTGVILLVFAVIAFVAWACALPGTPFLSITPHATAIGGWAVIILAAVLSKVADILDVAPKTR